MPQGIRQFQKYSTQFLAQIQEDLEELARLVPAQRDRAAFERVIKFLQKEINNERA